MPLTRSLQEVVFAVHFAEPLPLTMMDFTAWIIEYSGTKHPDFRELPPLVMTQMPRPNQQPFTLDLQLVGALPSLLPRVRIAGPSKHTLCVFQHDRIAFGWQRDLAVGEQADYPGYPFLRGSWLEEVTRFASWITKRLDHPVSPRLTELSYNNAYPLEVDGKNRRLSDIVRFVNPGYRTVNSFNVSWSEFLDPLSDGLIQANIGLGTAPPAQQVIGVNYFGLAAVDRVLHPSEVAAAVMKGADKLHDRILDMHLSTVVEGA